jgi:hypothetical protein
VVAYAGFGVFVALTAALASLARRYIERYCDLQAAAAWPIKTNLWLKNARFNDPHSVNRRDGRSFAVTAMRGLCVSVIPLSKVSAIGCHHTAIEHFTFEPSCIRAKLRHLSAQQNGKYLVAHGVGR